MSKGRSFIRKVTLVVGAFFAFFVAAAIIIPLVVDVDKYRPQIVQAANENINGKLSLGKLSLSLWGQIHIQIDGLSLSDVNGNEVVSVKNAFFHLPFFSILAGSPELDLKMQNPTVNVVKDRSGKLNVLSFVKSTAQPSGAPSTQASPPPGGAPAQPEKPSTVALPSIATRARLGIELRDALLTYLDKATGMSSRVENFNFVVHNISLSRTMDLELWADLNLNMVEKGRTTMELHGPAKVTAQATPELSGGKFERLTASFHVDLDQLEINKPGIFMKKKGVAANADGALKASPQEASIERFDVKFYNAEVKVSGVISNLEAKNAQGESMPVVKMNVSSNEISLKPWSEVIPMLKEYDLGGVATFDASADGPSSKLNYRADFALKGVTAKAPHLKSEPTIDAELKIATDQIEKLSLTMKAPANDLRVTGHMMSFTHPKLDVQVASSGMDLDQLIAFPPPAAAATKGEAAKASKPEAPASSGGPKEDFDALLEPIRENPVLASMVAGVGVNIKMLKAKGVKMTDIVGKLSFHDLTAAIEQFRLGLWGGSIQASMSAQLKPKTPVYQFKTDIAKLDLREAVTSQMELLKNTVVGTASFSMSGSGSSFNPDPAKVNLKAKGHMKIENAVFATIDVGKMVSDALNKSMENISSKIPGLKGQGIKSLSNTQSKYSLISSDVEISGGKFMAPNFVAKAEPNQGIDLKGNTTVGLVDYSLKASWEIIDTYNMTHARDISVSQGGVEIPHILAEGNNPVRFPIDVGGTVFAPTYSYAQVPAFLGKVALANASQAVQGKAKAELMKQFQGGSGTGSNSAPPAVQNAIQGLGKKLFGR